MQTITIYRYNRPDSGVTVSPVKPDGGFSEMYRLVADEGMILTDGNNFTTCTDTKNPTAWVEIVGADSELDEEIPGDEFKAMMEGVL